MTRFASLFCFVGFVVGCGATPEPSPGPAAVQAYSATAGGPVQTRAHQLAPETAPPAQPAPRTMGNSNASMGPDATTASCEDACRFLDRCPEDVFVGRRGEACVFECEREGPTWAGAFATCVKQVGCEQVSRSMAMNLGPLGVCMQRAGAFSRPVR
jgi:hypothetical protein